jgi:predicted permease
MLALRALTSADLPLPLPITLDLAPDGTVLTYAVAVSVIAGIIFGLAPALHGTRTQLASVLRDETAGGGRRGALSMRGMLVMTQVAVSLVLLVTAGLLLRSFLATQSIDPGFGARPAAVLTLSLRADRWSSEQGPDFALRLMEQFRTIDGVSDVALTGRLHLDPLNTWSTDVNVDGVAPPPDRDSHSIDWTPVTPTFFDVMGIRIVRGRAFTEADHAGATAVAVVNEAMAERFWPGEDPVGRTLRDSGETLTVVGVAGNARVRTLGEVPRPQLYRPFAQAYSSYFVAVASTARDAESTAIAMSRAARELDPDVFTWEPKSLARHLSTQLIARRLVAWIIGTFAVLALVLASVGLYGLVSYSVAQRRREVGIRMTLGADGTSVLRLLLGQGLRLVVIGVVAGMLAALALARLLAGLLYGVPPVDPFTFVVVPAILLGVATLAAWLPARRALRTDPVVALRSD